MSAASVHADASLLELYRLEAADQTEVLTRQLLALERDPGAPESLDACMRAAHSLKGAARIIGFEAGVKIAHTMEDCFVAAQRGSLTLDAKQIDAFLRDVDVLRNPGGETGEGARVVSIAESSGETTVEPLVPTPHLNESSQKAPAFDAAPADERMLRVTADHLDRLLRLAGESRVEARRLRQGEDHAHRLYEAALACRMRPFADGTHGFERMVRDLGRSLHKPTRLAIRGAATPVDRDILARLEAPLGHLLRNAVDHAIETPEERRAAGKSEEAVITLEARHHSGVLQVSVSDDGRGIPLERLRRVVIDRGLAGAENAARLSEPELLEFLFLPGFTLKDSVTEISGRGVGLDVVQDVLKHIRGQIRVTTQAGQGSTFQLQLPLTLSVDRTLLVEIAKEPYALPLAHIARTARIGRGQIEYLEGRPLYHDGQRAVSIVAARQLLHGEPMPAAVDLDVVLLGAGDRCYALQVDRFLGERELVVRPLDPRLGKVRDVAAAAVMEDGAPLLILDVEDLIRSIERHLTEGAGRTAALAPAVGGAQSARRRILVVDDSLTVRELERKLLTQQGYQVDVAHDGMDGWNAIRSAQYDLLITDVDMPRMDGIELVTCLKRDPLLKATPVMIVSYKDRPEDRRRGLEAGADHYLAKGGFHDDALIDAVRDLIGEAVSESAA